MTLTYERIFSAFGQYDTFVSLSFSNGTDEYNLFGERLMGKFIYTFDERKALEELISKDNIPDTDSKTKFKPSEMEDLSAEKIELLDRYGILPSSIKEVMTVNLPQENRFSQTGVKDIPNRLDINLPSIGGWEELNRMQFGFLSSRYQSKTPFSPNEEMRYWGLRKHLQIGLDKEDYIATKQKNDEFQKGARFYELQAKYHETEIEVEDLEEYAKLLVEQISSKNEIINEEIKKSDENIKSVAKKYSIELEELRKCCHSFDEKVISYGEKLIYLTFERFVHIYARHVSETQIGDRFKLIENKTVFQYKLEDILDVLSMVVKSVYKEIVDEFKAYPTRNFKRLGNRAINIDGHYYRIEIEPSGSIKDFHPLNHNK